MAKITLDPNKKDALLVRVGERIASLRKAKGLTQLRLSLLCETTQSYISDLEVGRRNPSLIILGRIAEALDCTLSELLLGVEEAK